MGSFRIVGESTIATGSFLRLDAVRIADPAGTVHERVVVRHPGAVVIVPVTDDGAHALLVRQYRAAVDAELLEVPAGKRDVEGEAPATTAQRELEEEIGYRARTLVPLAEFYNTPGFCDEYTHVFVALGLDALPERRTQTAEEAAMQVERIALVDVESLIAARELVDAKSIVGLLLARAHLTSGS